MLLQNAANNQPSRRSHQKTVKTVISFCVNSHLLKNKIAVPIVDEDVSVTYYAICHKGRSWRLLERFMNSRLQNQT